MPTKAEAAESARLAVRRGRRSELSSEPLYLAVAKEAAKLGLSESSTRLGRTVALHLTEHPVGEKRVGDVTSQDIADWVRQLPVRNTSKARYLEYLKARFATWHDYGLIYSNPASKVKKPPRDQVNKRILDVRDADEFLLLVPERYRLTVALNMHGLRTSEALGVKREDLVGPGVYVQRQADGNGRLVPYTKTRMARWVPLVPPVRRMVEQSPPGLLLATESGLAVNRHNYNRMLRSALEGTRFEGFRPTWLRSSCATWLLMASNAKVGSMTTGHSELTLMKVYAQPPQEAQVSAMMRAFGYEE